MKEIKIMVVEDSPETRNTLKDIFEMSLTEAPCEVVTCVTGEEAIEKLAKGLMPNFIILDINLPGISGGEVLTKLKDSAQWKKIPVFPYSSLWDEKTDLPFDEHVKVVKKWYEAAERSMRTGDRTLAQVTPKYQGQESVSTVHPRLVLFAASILIQQGIELTLSFRMLVDTARRVLEKKKDGSER